MSMARSSRMLRYINYRMRITLNDSRVLVGNFMAFDRHMNIVLGDTQEFRKIRNKKSSTNSNNLSEEREERRALGLIILRGDCVVSMTIEGPPPAEEEKITVAGGPGIVQATTSRLPITPLPHAHLPPRGLNAPPIASMLQPTSHIAASSMPRPLMPPPPPGQGLPPRGMPPGMMPPGMMPPGMMPGAPRPPGPPPGPPRI